MVPIMIMAQQAEDAALGSGVFKDKKKPHGWTLFPKPEKTPLADMNIQHPSDRKRRFDLPALFKSSSRTNLRGHQEDAAVPDDIRDIPNRSDASSRASRRRSMSLDHLANIQLTVPNPAPSPVPLSPPKQMSGRKSPAFPVRISSSSQYQHERQARRDRHEQEDYLEQQYQRRQQILRSHSPDIASAQSPTFSNDARSDSPDSFLKDMTMTLPALQHKAYDEKDMLEPLHEEDLDPGSFDLVAPPPAGGNRYSLEKRSEQLFSAEHLKIIFEDATLMLSFTTFLGAHRPCSVPMLVYHLDAVKALRAIEYSNAVAEALDPIEGFEFTKKNPKATVNVELKLKIKESFDQLVREDLAAYVTHTYVQAVSQSISKRITGTLPIALREASEGLAEVFCLTDPSRPDNPIVFSSEEFHRTTQYGLDYVIGRNCRFLQGPKTNPFSVRRLRQKVEAGKEHCEVFLNYRRDGSPFMNLLMTAPLCDSRGVIRYFIGAQVDVSGLVKECSDLESLQRLVDKDEKTEEEKAILATEIAPRDEFRELSQMLNLTELDIVRRYGGNMHKELYEENEDTNLKHAENWNKPRLVIKSLSPDGTKDFSRGLAISGQLRGIYQNYLLIRPYPSLRILFASPSLRVPGILQSPFMHKIGGSQRVRDELTKALAEGRGVTAKMRWTSKQDLEGRPRWFHCTPLIGYNGEIGVWMVILVDEDDSAPRHRQPPPVDSRLGRKSNSHASFDDGDGGSLRSFAIGGRTGAASMKSYASN